LGGGSADGTYMLRAVNELCELGLTRETLLELAAQLGSDCSFFVDGVPALVKGRGEHVSPLRSTWTAGLWVVVCNPGIHISTAEAFEGLTPRLRNVEWEDLLHQPVSSWSDEIQNDFEPGACTRHPEILDLLQRLRKAGAGYVQMTGSGSTVYGLFDDEAQARGAARNLTASHCGPLGSPQC
jgi:4-diphosphocytidyl-2-C-methyl-D-erythritol kinase